MNKIKAIYDYILYEMPKPITAVILLSFLLLGISLFVGLLDILYLFVGLEGVGVILIVCMSYSVIYLYVASLRY